MAGPGCRHGGGGPSGEPDGRDGTDVQLARRTERRWNYWTSSSAVTVIVTSEAGLISR
ncbi:MAG TPA: hypothetical protein VGF80_10175 [Galbitalea sp.]